MNPRERLDELLDARLDPWADERFLQALGEDGDLAAHASTLRVALRLLPHAVAPPRRRAALMLAAASLLLIVLGLVAARPERAVESLPSFTPFVATYVITCTTTRGPVSERVTRDGSGSLQTEVIRRDARGILRATTRRSLALAKSSAPLNP